MRRLSICSESFNSLCAQNCILGALSGKTVIYVTHQVEFLSAADLILVSSNRRPYVYSYIVTSY